LDRDGGRSNCWSSVQGHEEIREEREFGWLNSLRYFFSHPKIEGESKEARIQDTRELPTSPSRVQQHGLSASATPTATSATPATATTAEITTPTATATSTATTVAPAEQVHLDVRRRNDDVQPTFAIFVRRGRFLRRRFGGVVPVVPIADGDAGQKRKRSNSKDGVALSAIGGGGDDEEYSYDDDGVRGGHNDEENQRAGVGTGVAAVAVAVAGVGVINGNNTHNNSKKKISNKEWNMVYKLLLPLEEELNQMINEENLGDM